MAFPRMKNRKTGPAPSRQKPLVRFDGAAQLRDVVAEHLAKTSRLKKIALHVYDQERAVLGSERELVRIGGKVDGRTHGLKPALAEDAATIADALWGERTGREKAAARQSA
jgi:hypothetical protein